MQNREPHQVTSIIKRLLELEQLSIDEYHREASRLNDPIVSALFDKLARQREHGLDELNSLLDALDAKLVVQQINEMFL
jgi:rubrerythrin